MFFLYFDKSSSRSLLKFDISTHCSKQVGDCKAGQTVCAILAVDAAGCDVLDT